MCPAHVKTGFSSQYHNSQAWQHRAVVSAFRNRKIERSKSSCEFNISLGYKRACLTKTLPPLVITKAGLGPGLLARELPLPIFS